jgi:thymidylate kinase
VPDITFLFKLDPEVCIKRIIGRGNEFELFEEKEKLQKIWQNYEKIANDFPGIHVIDANRSIEEIATEIWKIVEEKL